MPFVIVKCETLEVASSLATALEKKKLLVTVASFDDVPLKTESKPVKKTEVILEVPKPADLKDILTEVKEELGVEALKDLMLAHNAKKLSELIKAEWATIYAEAKNLLKEANEGLDDDLGLGDDGLDDDLGLGDDDLDGGLDELDDDLGGSGEAFDLTDVKKLATQYANKHDLDAQRAIMGKFGIPTTRSLGKADDEQLNKIGAAFTKGLK